jgi:hypothetical protein
MAASVRMPAPAPSVVCVFFIFFESNQPYKKKRLHIIYQESAEAALAATSQGI